MKDRLRLKERLFKLLFFYGQGLDGYLIVYMETHIHIMEEVFLEMFIEDLYEVA